MLLELVLMEKHQKVSASPLWKSACSVLLVKQISTMDLKKYVPTSAAESFMQSKMVGSCVPLPN